MNNTQLALTALKIAALVIFFLSVDKFIRNHSASGPITVPAGGRDAE